MTPDSGGDVTAEPPRARFGTPDHTDRLLIVAAIALWLAALGAAVAAVVALVDLGSAHSIALGDSDTPWLLYTVIAVSALVIIGAIPLLLRARQAAASGAVSKPASPDGGQRPAAPAAEAQRLQPFGAPVLRRHSTPPAGSRVGFPTAAVEQIWLRCTATIAAAMGAAATGIGVATYLMAAGHDATAWVLYVVAAVITVAMAAAPWYFLRELHGVLEASS